MDFSPHILQYLTLADCLQCKKMVDIGVVTSPLRFHLNSYVYSTLYLIFCKFHTLLIIETLYILLDKKKKNLRNEMRKYNRNLNNGPSL